MKNLAMIILDGYGISKRTKGNAVKLANTPFLDDCFKNYPHSLLKTDGEFVGLEKGAFGNSEVGHLIMGAGRVVQQDLSLINKKIKNGEFYKNEILISAFENKRVHLIGLLTNGNVHADIFHLKALIQMAKRLKTKEVFLHLITDGRDTDVHYAKTLINQIILPSNVKIASVSGRFYAMDRELNLDRTEKYFKMLIKNNKTELNIQNLLEKNYNSNITDEFIEPTALKDFSAINEKDSVIFFNFRADRMRQLCRMFIEHFKSLHIISFTQYSEDFKSILVAFKKNNVENCLSEILSKNGIKQLRVAETTKYAHVTYFFNGEKEQAFANEKRAIVKGDSAINFADNPEMKAKEIVETTIQLTSKENFNFVLLNFANCDMVGHTGNLNATIKAVEFVDRQLKILCDDLINKKFSIIITADHGNADYMLDKDNNAITTHSCAPAPFIFISNKTRKVKKTGKLSNIAPTILEYFNISIPNGLMDKSLFK